MDKCREAFEKQKHLTIYISNLVFDKKDNRYIPNEKRIRTFEEWEWKAFSNQAWGVNLAWWAWQSRQAEINQLQSQINEMAEVGLSQESAIREKDKRIEELQAKVDAVEHILGCAMIAPKEVFQYADRIGRALRGKDQYKEHRASAEEQIKKGARLTKHQIDLGGNNANS